MAYIQSIGLAKAPFRHTQKDIFNFIVKMYKVPITDRERLERMYERSEIETRYAVINDFSLANDAWTFFEKEGITSVEKRMKLFFELAPKLGIQAVQRCVNEDQLKKVTHLISVSCTGVSAPGLDIQLLQLLELPSSTHRSSVNFMGCYAVIHALKQANAICMADPSAHVLIVAIELCTLHFQDEYTNDNIAASLLFADGAAATLINNEKGSYSIEKFYSDIAMDASQDMAWEISSSGFLMTLSNYVPTVIAEKIKPMLLSSLDSMHCSKDDIKHWAIHPGGKKIVSEIQKALSLSNEDVAVSRSVLRDYGNMSSVTILFVLEQMRSQIINSNELVYAVAFGPGLTIESMFLKSC